MPCYVYVWMKKGSDFWFKFIASSKASKVTYVHYMINFAPFTSSKDITFYVYQHHCTSFALSTYVNVVFNTSFAWTKLISRFKNATPWIFVLSVGLSLLLQFLVLSCLLLQSSSLIPSQPVQLGVWSWLHEHWISPAFSGWPLLLRPTCSFVQARGWSSQRGSSRQVKHVFFLQFDWRLWSHWLFSSPNEQNWSH